MAKLDEQQPPASKQRRKPATDGPKSDLRGRDLIYIDTDDDVTSIVGRIKQSSEVVVALVPPKRIGVLQSVVNLRLLQRAAKMAKKRLAIVTTDPSLVNLASGLGIPVAKNINAQAKVPDMVDEEEISDVIDGNDIAVSDIPRSRREASEDKEISAAVAAIETDDRIKNDLDADGVPDDEEEKPKKPAKKKSKVPNINSLRNKLLIGGGIAVVLIGFLVWALIFAPQATITIQAKTSPLEISKTLTLIPSSDKDVADGRLSPVVKQKKTNESVEFEATGSREVGENAAGTVAFCYDETNFNPDTGEKNAITLDAGTRLYANNVQFTIDSAVTIEGGRKSASGKCETYYRVKATAVNIGEEGNIAKNTEMSVAGYSSLEAVAYDDFTGGSKETVKVVQQSDVDAAVAKLRERGDSDAARDELKGQMSDSTVVIDSSFNTSQGEVKVSPAVGESPAENGKATASLEVTYTLVGVDRDDLGEVLDGQLKSETDGKNQKVYNNGLDEVKFSGFTTVDNGYSVVINTNGHVGPIINEDDVRKQAVGKKSEEIRALLMETDGVNDVSVNMSPFWVSKAPAENKIKVNFEINE